MTDGSDVRLDDTWSEKHTGPPTPHRDGSDVRSEARERLYVKRPEKHTTGVYVDVTDQYVPSWGDNRDEFPLRDMRWRCPNCELFKAFGPGELCGDCERASDITAPPSDD